MTARIERAPGEIWTSDISEAFRDAFLPDGAMLKVRQAPERDGRWEMVISADLAARIGLHPSRWGSDEDAMYAALSEAQHRLQRRLPGLRITSSRLRRRVAGHQETVAIMVVMPETGEFVCTEECGRSYKLQLSAMICPAVHGVRP